MTISSTTVKNSYSGNGTLDTFNYTFKIFADSDLQVIIRDATATETVKTLTTHYTVTGAGSASGGTIVFTAGNIPSATETVVIRRAVPQTQAIDYIANDPFPAESHEEGLDRSMMTLQQLQEEVDRSIKLSRTNTMTSTEFAVGATNRANKVLAFDTNGEISVTQELGTFVGNWSSSTDFNGRDIVKDTTNNNIYIANTAHTSSGSLPISSNTDVAKWDLLVDAASATSSATAAASSATAAAASASAAATSATNAATSETNAATSESNASTSETNAATSATSAASSATSASTSATTATTKASEASTSATNAATSETNAASSATSAASSATTATTKASEASTSATNAATSETNAASSASAASTSETNAATSATTASTAATAAQAAQTAAELAADNFDDTYLGAKASDPTVDNDGDALTAGDLYFNTSSNEVKYYNGTSWSAISPGITDIVSDTTPQLGGNLDVNGNSIVSVSNGNISITPDGTGKVIIDGLSHPTSDGTADQVLKTDGAGNLSFGDVSGATNPFRNIIINGDMSIAQRGTSVTGITDGSSGHHTCDRWRTTIISAGTWTQSQSTDVPTGQGFAKSLKMDCTTANASLSAGTTLNIQGRFEGQNLQYLKKGTANAESVTMSFWVKSNKTGTYICEIRDKDNSRDFSKSYTISSADTWEKKTLTYAGDTTGAFDNDNARSLDVLFYLTAGTDYTSGTLQSSWYATTNANRAVGQVNLADSTSNEWYITGVQLEVGSAASDFEFLPVDVNLQRCFRYFEKFGGGNIHGGSYNGATTIGHVQYKLRKRATPTLSNVTGNNVSSTVAGIDNFHFTGTQPSYVVSASMDSEL